MLSSTVVQYLESSKSVIEEKSKILSLIAFFVMISLSSAVHGCITIDPEIMINFAYMGYDKKSRNSKKPPPNLDQSLATEVSN